MGANAKAKSQGSKTGSSAPKAKAEPVSAYQAAKQRSQAKAEPEPQAPQIDTSGMSAYQLKKLAMSGAASVTSKSGGSGKIGSMSSVGSSMNSHNDKPPWNIGGHISAESADEIADDDYF